MALDRASRALRLTAGAMFFACTLSASPCTGIYDPSPLTFAARPMARLFAPAARRASEANSLAAAG